MTGCDQVAVGRSKMYTSERNTLCSFSPPKTSSFESFQNIVVWPIVDTLRLVDDEDREEEEKGKEEEDEPIRTLGISP